MLTSTLASVSTLGNDCLRTHPDQRSAGTCKEEKRERLARLKTKLEKNFRLGVDQSCGKIRAFFTMCATESADHFGMTSAQAELEPMPEKKRRAGGKTSSSSSSSICVQPFDYEYRHACNNNNNRSWGRKWGYFDAMNGFCRHFWYAGQSRNIFEGLKQCMDLCVHDNVLVKKYSREGRVPACEFVPNRLTVAMNGMQWQPDQRWLPRFYFHLRSADECRQFWYGGCQFGSSQQFFQAQKKHLEASIGRCRLFWMDVSCPSPRSERLPVAQHFCACAKRRRACQGEKECIGHEGEQDEFWRWRE
uniref:BPTI/Kunitz inhibitor domain-containing protein n=1 Tax=Globodera pallida TaxID=36090 RepID=A0A183CJ11_GLOPA